MERAAVLIGVKKTGGGLPVLQAVNSSLAEVTLWLDRQQVPDANRRLISDPGGQPVTVAAIKEAIASLLGRGNIDQLIVYFSGHGMSKGSSEYWLLTDAPGDANEAVNVEQSISFARRASVPHIIFVSDACRTPAADTIGQSVEGASIFPNVKPRQAETSVDVFFGCGLGHPSLEIKADEDAGAEFRAVFTDSLVHALMGNVSNLLEVRVPTASDLVVRAWPLKKHLKEDVVSRIRNMRLAKQATQLPDARITSDPALWISILQGSPSAGTEKDVAVPQPSPSPPAVPPSSGPPPPPLPKPFDIEKVADTMILDVLKARTEEHFGIVASRAPRVVDARERPLKEVVRRVRGFGQPESISSQGRIQAYGIEATDLSGEGRSLAGSDGPVVSWVGLQGGGYLQVPMMEGFITTVTGNNGQVEEISLMPSTLAGVSSQSRLDKSLSAHISGAAAAGGFNPDRELIKRIYADSAAGAMLSLGASLHLGYAMHDWDMQAPLAELTSSWAERYGFYLYDLTMLSGNIYSGEPLDKQVLPDCPMITKGWNLIEAFVATPSARNAVLRRWLLPTLWTTFNAEGYARKFKD